jgi:hypothetical protein
MVRVIGGDESYYYPPVPDDRGQLVARLREESTVDLFDLQTGTLVDTIPPYPDAAKTGIAFAPGGQSLVTVINTDSRDSNAEMVVRDLSPSALVSAACAAAGSNLSSDEWQALAGGRPAGADTCP